MKKSASLAYAKTSSVEDNARLRTITHDAEQSPLGLFDSDVFDTAIREANEGRVIVLGRASRKRTTGYLNIPIGNAARDRLNKLIVGSLAMGVSGLLEWALAEIERKRIVVEIHAKP